MKRKGNSNINSKFPNKKSKGNDTSVAFTAFLTPKTPYFCDLTDEILEQIRICNIESGYVVITSLNHKSSVFTSIANDELHREILQLIGDLCPKSLKFQHPEAENVMQHYVLKKEIVLSITERNLELFGERIFFHDFEFATSDENKKQICVHAIGLSEIPEGDDDPFPSRIISRKPADRYYLKNVSRQVNSSIGKEVSQGHCLVSSVSPETTIFINDDEGGLHQDYNNWQTKFTKKYNFKNELKRVMMGREILVSINKNNLDFGTWEQIFDGSFSKTMSGKGGYKVKSIGGNGLRYYRKVLQHRCKNRFHPVNITEIVRKCVKDSGMTEAICLVNSMHITSGCFVGVDDQRLLDDLFKFLEFIAPEKPWTRYNHNGYETNGDAHHKRQILSRSVVLPVVKGEIILGDENYSVFYGECDGQRTKRQLVTIVGI